jgi:hypothetical protein
MKQFPTVISFYTDDWEYPDHAERLKKECDSLGLHHRIERLESQGGYLQNCSMKPDYIFKCLTEEKRPVLWIDVDASILNLPEYFVDLNADISAKRMPLHRNRTWHVGTLWVNYNQTALDYVKKWSDIPKEWSDELNFNLLYNSTPGIVIVDMPATYFRLTKPGKSQDPNTVILHRSSDGPSKKIQLKNA